MKQPIACSVQLLSKKVMLAILYPIMTKMVEANISTELGPVLEPAALYIYPVETRIMGLSLHMHQILTQTANETDTPLRIML